MFQNKRINCPYCWTPDGSHAPNCEGLKFSKLLRVCVAIACTVFSFINLILAVHINAIGWAYLWLAFMTYHVLVIIVNLLERKTNGH